VPRKPKRVRDDAPLDEPAVQGDERRKEPFDIDRAIQLVREAVKPFKKAAMFELADDGYDLPFEQLVACIISIRTLDEVSLPTAKRLFEVARTPKEIASLSVAQIDERIRASTFHEPKARTIRDIAQRVVEEFKGKLPCDAETLLSFRGVGPKCAHLTLGIACNHRVISVDVHVHRVANRWGYVQATIPERTMLELQKKLPKKYWVEINRLLVPFGKHTCTGTLPRCSTCPVLSMCRQVGVTKHR
jgi:endonuclease-3